MGEKAGRTSSNFRILIRAALIIMVCSVGFEKTFCDLLPKYPGLILIPVFSCFTFGPIDGKSPRTCCDLSCQRSFGVSLTLTWLNMCTTIICVFLAFPILASSSIEGSGSFGTLPTSFLLLPCVLLYFLINTCSLAIMQCCMKDCTCCCTCCINCIQRTSISSTQEDQDI